ncbi:MAG: FAD-dependent oxidoreductase [Clostridia bacterium]|nr:FAD-dependent oxidoreductase [Clostridia bacterium]
MEYVIEPARRLEVSHNCDVLVCGGGVAGIAAALAARRAGADVLLIDREYTLGGLATLGIVTVYLPICDGMGHQIIYGIGEELLRLSVKKGMSENQKEHPADWLARDYEAASKGKLRFQVQYNPMAFAAEAERLLLSEGVKILYATTVTAVTKEDDRITSVIIENKSGRSAIAVKTVVDSTGDADVCKLADEATAVYSPGNVLSMWHYRYTAEKGVRLVPKSEPYNALLDPVKVNTVHKFSGLDADELSNAMSLTRQVCYENDMEVRQKDPTAVPTLYPTIPLMRMTRRICGKATVGYKDRMHQDTSVGVFPDWRKRGPVFELPFGCLHGNNVKNLITAGRNISATDEMWDVTRVIPVCAVTGEAAGVAAAMFDDFTTADVAKLQERLRKNGVRLHIDEVI